MEALTQAEHKAAAALYQQASAGGAGATGSQGPTGDAGASRGAPSDGEPKAGDVIDAEVVDDKS